MLIARYQFADLAQHQSSDEEGIVLEALGCHRLGRSCGAGCAVVVGGDECLDVILANDFHLFLSEVAHDGEARIRMLFGGGVSCCPSRRTRLWNTQNRDTGSLKLEPESPFGGKAELLEKKKIFESSAEKRSPTTFDCSYAATLK